MVETCVNLAPLESAIAFQIQRSARIMRHYLALVLKGSEVELGPEQFTLLFRVRDNPGCSQTDLADHVLIDTPNISRHVDAMVTRGLIERRAHPRDRRRHALYLTDTGNKAFARLSPIIEDERAILRGSLDEDRVNELLQSLREVTENATQRIRDLETDR